MIEHRKVYIDGAWVEPEGKTLLDVINPTTEAVAGRVPLNTASDVDRAVKAARAAFDEWSATPLETRLDYMNKILKALIGRASPIAEIISTEMGMPLKLSKAIQVGLPIASLKTTMGVAKDFPFEETVGTSLVVREAVGVCAFITPWNYPLHQVVAKFAPALAAGCTMVLKPSEVAPLACFEFAKLVDEVGLPKGVFNLVMGEGPVVGEALAAHPDVDMVSFTGSTRAGRRVAELASATVKRVSLELGGKSANIILPDADLETAVKAGVKACYLNAGQTCSALTRMLVHKDQVEAVAEIAARVAQGFTLGAPEEEATRMGPMVSAAQHARVLNFIQKGIDEGAILVTGGSDKPTEVGYFVQPTVFKNVTSTMTIAREEIFGPVLSIMAYEDENEAVAIANDSPYGLAGGVWSADENRAKAVARRLRTGQVDINGGAYNPAAPFGGYKQSGNGREMGRFGLEEFLEVKALNL